MNPEFWKGKEVLVTGHAGFVGANLVKRLKDLGACTFGLDVVATSPSLKVLGAHPYHTFTDDVNDGGTYYAIAHGPKYHAIFHLAGFGHIKHCQDEPRNAFLNHLMGTVHMLDAVRIEKDFAPAIVVASSNHVYIGGSPKVKTTVGAPRRHGGGYGLNEASPLNAVDAYGAAKVCADHAVRCFRESYGLRAAAVRHVNSYGPADPHDSHLVTGAILACLAGQIPTLRSDGSAVKGYLHVADVVDAYLTIAEHIDDLPGHAVNVSDPDAEASALAIARTVIDVAGMAGGPIIQGVDLTQKGYEERLDATLLRSLGWTPLYSLYGGIRNTYEWYKEHGAMRWRDGS